jgi:CheY-like chemotaxis protein
MHCDYVLSDPEGINRALSSIEQIQRSAFRAAGLTRQLLAFCRKQVVKLEILSVNAVISNVKPMIESLIGDKIQVIFTLGGSLDKVRADLVQIEQLIMNLSINARDAMPEGGRLKIETRNVQVDGASWVELAISDSGIGMDVATQKRIFEPFFTTKGPDKGTGLGLATVYNIVQHCGGRIAVQSEVGKGSRFIIRLPKVGEESQTHSAPKGTAKSAPQRHLRILLMEDEPEVRKILKTIIEEKGFEVIAPATCDEAVAIYRQEHKDIHLVISDVNLPGMSGPALARLLSEIKPSMQVLFISGYFDDDPNMRQVVERGHFLQKPFSHDQLIEKILEVAAPR